MLMLSAMFFFLPVVTVAPPFVAALGPVAALAVPAMSFDHGDSAPAAPVTPKPVPVGD